MGKLRKSRKKQAGSRLRELEKRFDFDLKDLEKKFGKLDLKELEKRIDFKDLEKKLDFDTERVKRYAEAHLPHRKEEKESSSAGFIAGLVVGAIIGVVLAIVFGKKQNGEVMDQFAHRAETLRDTAAERYHQVRGDAAGEVESAVDQFGDDPAIEREVHGDDDVVNTARDVVDSASEDVQDTLDDVAATANDLGDEAKRRNGQT